MNTEKPQTTIKKRKGRLTARKQKLYKLMVENGSKPDGQLMREAGYSEAYAGQPSKMRKTLSWQELMDRDIPEKALIREHKRKLKAVVLSHRYFPSRISDGEIGTIIRKIKGAKLIYLNRIKNKPTIAYFTMPDENSRDSALDKGYKLRGSYHIDKSTDKINEALEKALDRISRILPDAES